MARTRRVYRLKKNLIPTLDAEATNSPPSNQPQPPAGKADSPPRGGFKTPPRRDLTNDALSEVPTSEPPANPPEERSFPSKENSPCATKACPFNGTVYQFTIGHRKMPTRTNFTA